MTERRLVDRLKRVLSLNVDRGAKAALMAEEIRKEGAYRWVGIYDVDAERGVVTNLAWSGPSAPAFPVFPTTKGITSRAIAEKKIINVGDVAKDPNYLTALDSTQAEIIVPVLSKTGVVVGTIDVESERRNRFDTDAQRMLEECAQALASFWTVGR